MEVKITISSEPASPSAQSTTTIQVNSSTVATNVAVPMHRETEGGQGAAQRITGAPPHDDTGQALDTNALPAGQAMVGSGASEAGARQISSLILPSPELLRKAAAIGAANAGPAHMLSGPATGMTPGEPQQFLATNAEMAILASIGAPDQLAGAAPESERMTPIEIVQEQPSKGEAE